MAWYRCGGGGIPSSLKGDMNDVFNKKFGTTLQDYPPEDWPGTVNLMGPLPERTVSGAVVTFSDGADNVPIKSASFGIVASGGGGTPSTPVPIVGHSSVTVYHTDGQTPPVESEQVTIQLGQTVYGGTLASDGTLTITHWCDIWDDTKNYNVSDNLTNVFRFYKNYEKPTSAPATVKCLCAIGNFSRTGWSTDSVSFSSDSNNLTLKLSKTEVTDITEAKAWLAQHNVYFIYELTTPIVITGLDEISLSTYLGDNSIWADTGDASVTYRRDIDLALAQ